LLLEAALQQSISEVGGGQIISLPQYHYEPSYVQQHTPHFERNNQSSNEATRPGSFQQYISYSSSSNQLSLLPTMPQQQHQAPHFQHRTVPIMHACYITNHHLRLYVLLPPQKEEPP
jgi:hypothetical protein